MKKVKAVLMIPVRFVAYLMICLMRSVDWDWLICKIDDKRWDLIEKMQQALPNELTHTFGNDDALEALFRTGRGCFTVALLRNPSMSSIDNEIDLATFEANCVVETWRKAGILVRFDRIDTSGIGEQYFYVKAVFYRSRD